MQVIDPGDIAKKYLDDFREAVSRLATEVTVVGFIASDDKPSVSYAKATRRLFNEVGFNYDLRQVKRLELEQAIIEANEDTSVHGIFIYFPVFKNQEDDYLRNLVHYTKDVEAGSLYWTRKMTANDRLVITGDERKKALLPCTPLAIVKILEDLGEYPTHGAPTREKTATIFNRSEVIGRPLAVMMSNDGVMVYSFDENGPLLFRSGTPAETSISRAEALAASDIVITGVPSNEFRRVSSAEVPADALCLNFSSVENFEDDLAEHARIYVPRVGPMTVAMCMRNSIRLYENFHQ
jgi:methylenetetrahydrofolate dehydrogenase (NADP+)/methenyltetrahydrofolate cyclohydrolase